MSAPAARRRVANGWQVLRASAGLLLVTLSLASCSFDESANPQHDCGACPPGQCHLGFCLSQGQNQLPATGTAATGGTVSSGQTAGSSGQPNPGGASGSGTAGRAGTGSTVAGSVAPQPCSPNTACYSADQATLGVGHCRGGQCDATGTCIGELLPEPEACNMADDDCDGAIDEELTLGSCDASTGAGACSAGVMECQNGVSMCQPAEPQAETCNGLDDDCDGAVDNGLDSTCYPDGMDGCSDDGAGGFTCRGRCASGSRRCTGGAIAECAGFTGPGVESCGDDDPGDEDCDGKVDEGCSCSGSATQACYTGPILTAGIGICKRGQQHCVDGKFGPCTGSVVPSTETCANQGVDNDCNPFTDIPNLNTSCSTGMRGECRTGVRRCSGNALVCVAPSPKPDTTCDGLDENCNGTADETFAFMTDEAHCGSCTNSCGAGDMCCGGGCIHPLSDPNNCGMCGKKCGANLACCNGQCVDTNSNDHCGGCNACDTSQGKACCGRACIAPTTNAACGATCDVCMGAEACCGGSCVVPNTNTACGSSCEACTGGKSCCGGSCIMPTTVDACGSSCIKCAANEQCCGGGCVPLDTGDHCGSCTGCTGGLECCPGSPNSCIDTKTDEANCGGCGVPCGKTCCDGACVDPQMETNNCGVCGHACPMGCTCSEGNCLTPEGQACLPPG